jgi:hypothetical protein
VSATIREIVDDALTVIGEASGPGVETYSQDRMMSDTIRAFDLLFKKYYWEQFTEWFRLELDGTLGIVNSDAFLNVRDYEDFYSVHKDGQQQPLPILPRGINPYTIGSGTSLRYWTSLSATDENFDRRRLQFWPKQSTGFVNICARVYPIDNDAVWDWEDIMYLDKQMLVAGVAYMTLSADDLNSGAADAQRQMMEMRFSDIKASLSDRPMLVSGPNSPIPDQYFTV